MSVVAVKSRDDLNPKVMRVVPGCDDGRVAVVVVVVVVLVVVVVMVVVVKGDGCGEVGLWYHWVY